MSLLGNNNQWDVNLGIYDRWRRLIRYPSSTPQSPKSNVGHQGATSKDHRLHQVIPALLLQTHPELGLAPLSLHAEPIGR